MRSDLAAKLEQMQRNLERTREQLANASEQARAAQAVGSSDDGLITVTVTASDGLTDLAIDPRAMRRYDSASLAATILTVIGQANLSLRESVSASYQEILGGTLDPQALSDDPAATEEAIRSVARQLRGD